MNEQWIVPEYWYDRYPDEDMMSQYSDDIDYSALIVNLYFEEF